MHAVFRLFAASAGLLFTACAATTVCEAPSAAPDAAVRTSVKTEKDGRITAVLPNGMRVTPAGTLAKHCNTPGIGDKCIGAFPTGMALSPGGEWLAVVHSGVVDATLANRRNNSVRIVDAKTLAVVQTIETPNSFVGVRFNPAGDRLYVSGGVSNAVFVYAIAATGYATHVTDFAVGGNPYGLDVTPDGQWLLVAASHLRELWILSTDDGRVRFKVPVGDLPYEVVTDGKRAYTSNLGSDDVSAVDLATGRELSRIPVGKNPEGLLLHGKTLWAANSDGDSVSEIDTAALAETRRIALRGANEPGGMSPTSLALSPDGARLYVTVSADNSVDVLDAATGVRFGRIPTAYYPDVVRTNAAGELYVLNLKGLSAGPQLRPEGEWKLNGEEVGHQYGILQQIASPTDGALAGFTRQVEANRTRPLGFFKTPDAAKCDLVRSPIPLRTGDPSPIKHVVWIVKENKSYDILLGDLRKDEWHEPSYAVFGERVTIFSQPERFKPGQTYNVTPNTHKLARTYVNHVNYHALSDWSTQGHTWLTGGFVNDYVEKTWVGMQARSAGQFLLPNIEPAAVAPMGDIFDWYLGHGKSVRIYGEYVGSANGIFGRKFDAVVHDYVPGINRVKDTEKIKIFLRDLRNGPLADFTYVWIPNDHTLGYGSGKPHPAFMVADNDAAAGQLVEAISKSPQWENTVIFILEDDPSDSPDHIEGHRSILLTVSPFAKRSATVTTHANFLSVHRTTMALLGVPPMTRLIANTPPLWDDFELPADLAARAQATRYAAAPIDPNFGDGTRWEVATALPLAALGEGMDFNGVDRNPRLGVLLWKAMRGPGPVPAGLLTSPADEEDSE